MPKWYKALRAPALLAAALATAGPAFAAPSEILSGLSNERCDAASKTVSNGIVFEYAISAFEFSLDLPMEVRTSPARMQVFAGQIAATSGVNPSTLDEEGKKRQDFYLKLLNFVAGRETQDNFSIRIGTGAPAAPRDRVIAFLAQPEKSNWLTIACDKMPKTPATGGGGSEPVSGLLTYLGKTRIAKDLEGASEEDVADSSFATIAGKRDDEANTESYSIDAFLLFEGFGSERSKYRPYVGFQRAGANDPTKDVNDLTFGVDNSRYWETGDTHGFLPEIQYLDASLSWETDDQFDSSVTRAEVIYRPYWGGKFPTGAGINGCAGPNTYCVYNVAAVADFAEVSDAGEKTALADVEQYGRLGYNLEGSVHWAPDKFGDLSLGFTYKLRDTFTDDDDGDAQYLTARLGYSPPKAGNYSFGLDYVRGEDLTSLEKQEYWALSFGFRR